MAAKFLRRKVGILSLGCPRNLVDSEVMLGLLEKRGYIISDDIGTSDVAIVNTCAFIDQAKEESIDAILQLAELKKEGKIKAVVVAGCLAQRYGRALSSQLANVDALVGTSSFQKIGAVVEEVLAGRKVSEIGPPKFLYNHLSPRLLITPSHYAYLKIAEGCANRCSYCIIPQLRGDYRSRNPESVIEETRMLADSGVREINLISQDSTLYGNDIFGEPRLVNLLKRLTKVKGIKWIRLLYCHPAHFTGDLIGIIADEPSICKYIDLPLQHINDEILTKMKRLVTKKDILSLIEKLRRNIPELAIRTSLIVGFPGETDSQFRELLDFIRQMRFERLGIFIYSREVDTPAFGFSNQVPDKIKKSRFKETMLLQQDISREVNRSFLGRELEVLVDEVDQTDPDLFIGRTQADAPEVDGVVFVRSKKAKVGDFLRVKIIDTYEYDLVGTLCSAGEV